MLKKILIGVVAVVVLFVGVVFMQPAEFTLQRSMSIAAPADVVFAQVNDFHAWAAWSPWEKMDPAMKKTFEGSPMGPGAIYSWAGDKSGSGKMTIVATKPSEMIDIKLEFTQPFEATNPTMFTFQPDGAQTKVTWTMKGHNSFVSKAIGLFMSMEKMVGPQFEEGLTSMKAISEAEAKKRAEAASATATPPATPPADAAAAPAHP